MHLLITLTQLFPPDGGTFWVIVAILLALAIIVGFWALVKVIQAAEAKPIAGLDKLVGELGRVSQPIAAAEPYQPPMGKVKVFGEIWDATASESLPVNTRIRVVSVDPRTKILTVTAQVVTPQP
jgi:membrane protein implicated in regulation of membrane protease activity